MVVFLFDFEGTDNLGGRGVWVVGNFSELVDGVFDLHLVLSEKVEDLFDGGLFD